VKSVAWKGSSMLLLIDLFVVLPDPFVAESPYLWQLELVEGVVVGVDSVVVAEQREREESSCRRG